MFFSAPVMAEPIELICKHSDGDEIPLIIDIENNTVTFSEFGFVATEHEIYYKDVDYIIWVMHYKFMIGLIIIQTLERETGILRGIGLDYKWMDLGAEPTWERQCFRPL